MKLWDRETRAMYLFSMNISNSTKDHISLKIRT